MGPRNDELGTLDEKAETLVTYSYFMSAGKFILVNLQRAAYIFYDAKIATSELLSMLIKSFISVMGIYRRWL